jgi:cytochrome P450
VQKEFSFQPFTKEFARDPYAVYSRMRKDFPVYYHNDWDMHLFSRYEDIFTLLNDPRLVRTLEHKMTANEINSKRERENWQATPNFSRYVRVNILDSEGELHDRLRRLVFKVFTVSRVSTLREYIQKLVDDRIHAVINIGQMDFIEDFVAAIPGAVIGNLLGVPEVDRPRLRAWSEHIVRFYEPQKTDEDIQRAEQASGDFADYLIHLAERRRKKPQQDLISELVAAESKGQLSRDELISTCMIILMAGHGSTIDVAGNGMLALLQHREQMEKLQANPSLMQTAVQEMFRYDSPLPFFHRFMLEEMEYKGHVYEKGSKIGVLYASANRDPAQFENPDSFEISRQANRHLAFGTGPHFCLGNHLARLNMDIIFTSLLQHFSCLSLECDEPEFRIGLSSRGLRSLPVSWQA